MSAWTRTPRSPEAVVSVSTDEASNSLTRYVVSAMGMTKDTTPGLRPSCSRASVTELGSHPAAAAVTAARTPAQRRFFTIAVLLRSDPRQPDPGAWAPRARDRLSDPRSL